MNIDRHKLLLYAITNRSWLGEQTLYQQVEAALKGGVTCLQLREKDLTYQDFLNQAQCLKPLCQQYGVPLIINDNVEVALACDADGVHIGQTDMSAKQVRQILGSDKIVGVSAKTVKQALRAEADGADYLGVGAFFGTSTKGDAVLIDRAVASQICQAVSIPVVAIGGITLNNIDQLAGNGIAGAAIISAIFSADDIAETCRQLREHLESLVL